MRSPRTHSLCRSPGRVVRDSRYQFRRLVALERWQQCRKQDSWSIGWSALPSYLGQAQYRSLRQGIFQYQEHRHAAQPATSYAAGYSKEPKPLEGVMNFQPNIRAVLRAAGISVHTVAANDAYDSRRFYKACVATDATEVLVPSIKGAGVWPDSGSRAIAGGWYPEPPLESPPSYRPR